MLNDLGEFDFTQGIPVIQSVDNDETPGYWSLWQISAKNFFETKTSYQCFFIADNGKKYAAYANDIWNRLIGGDTKLRTDPATSDYDKKRIERELNDALFIVFQNLQADVVNKMKFKAENRINSYNFQRSRIDKIGIENIRKSKLKRLDTEHEQWLKEFQSNKKIIPGIKQLLTIRVNG